MRKPRRLILLLAIFISLGGVMYKVAESMWAMKAREIKKNPLKVLEYLPESALQIKDFHRAKMEDGRKVWELYGDEASYFKEQKEVVIKKPRFYYYDKKGEAAETTATIARLYFNEKELEKMQLEGAIEINFRGYLLKSDKAIYLPDKDQIVFPERTTGVGEGLELEGARMEVELQGEKVRLLQNVKTKIEPENLAERKDRAKSRGGIGG